MHSQPGHLYQFESSGIIKSSSFPKNLAFGIKMYLKLKYLNLNVNNNYKFNLQITFCSVTVSFNSAINISSHKTNY